MKQFTITAGDGLPLAAAMAEKDDPKAIVQIIHGSKEHKERYYDFMEFLQRNGYAAVISDNRGHGASVNEAYPLGYMHGTEEIVADQRLVTQKIMEKYPHKPIYLFGHSFGTLLAREYIQKYDADVQKLVLSGTVNYIPASVPGCLLGRLITKIRGEKGESRFLQSFLDGKDNSWVVKDAGMLEKYRQDPLCCGYLYMNGALMTVFESVRRLHKYNLYDCHHPSLPILLISGEEDPITGGEKGLADTIASLQKIGYSDIRNIVYKGMKHEVLNETEHEKVYADILTFFAE